MSNSRTADKFVVRMADGMRNDIAALAKKQHTSMNAVILQAVEAHLQREDQMGSIASEVTDISIRLGALEQRVGGSHA